MPLDARAKRFLDTLAAMQPPSALSLTVAERRAGLANLLSFAGRPPPVGAIADLSVPGPSGPLTVRSYSPSDQAGSQLLPGLAFFHGGGLVAGTLDTHDPICRSLSHATGCRVLSIDYRLAPEHRFPAAVADGCAAVTWLAQHASALGIDPGRLGIGGDSAGATLAAVVCQSLQGVQPVHLAFQFLLCPITDLAAESASRRSFASGYLVDADTLEHDLKHYLPEGTDRADPRISPLYAPDLSGLPPTAVHTAEYDPLRDEGQAYAGRLKDAGVRTIYRCHPGMIHLFYGMAGVISQAGAAYALMGEDVRALLTPAEKRTEGGSG
jgi:acetyl esterase/lipase